MESQDKLQRQSAAEIDAFLQNLLISLFQSPCSREILRFVLCQLWLFGERLCWSASLEVTLKCQRFVVWVPHDNHIVQESLEPSTIQKRTYPSGKQTFLLCFSQYS